MLLKDIIGKKVRVKLKDGTMFEGYVTDHISALDNEPDPESILIEPGYELFAPEIAKIEEIR